MTSDYLTYDYIPVAVEVTSKFITLKISLFIVVDNFL